MNPLIHLPSGIRDGLDFLIDRNWSPEQAFAVVELLDDLRTRIWMHYETGLDALIREQRSPPDPYREDELDAPF
jgi:hypothetical protein